MGRTKQFTDAAYAELFRYDWPGNIRELRNFLERLCILCSRSTIDADDITACLRRWDLTNRDSDMLPTSPLKEVVEQAERTHIENVLEYVKGNNEAAIEILKVSRTKYWDRLQRYGFK